MKNSYTAPVIAQFVMWMGVLVMFGWVFEIQVMKSILPGLVTMKFVTALSFCMSGMILCFISKARQGKKLLAQTVLPLPCLLVTLLMATLLVSVFLDLNTGIEELFIQEKSNAIQTTKPGRPSIGTMIGFLLIVSAGFMTLMDVKAISRKLRWIGWLVLSLGCVALTGYLLNTPVFYFSWSHVSTAMAVHTALLFGLLGVGLISTSNLQG